MVLWKFEKPMIVEDPRCLEIYISSHCVMSDYTWEVIELIQQEFPQVELHVIDIAKAANLPDAVFATPTYLLNGRLWSLGNPSLEMIQAALGQ